MMDENKDLTQEEIEKLETKNKKQKRKVVIRNIVIIGLIVIILLLLLAKCSNGDITPPPQIDKYFNTQIDDSAKEKTEKDKQAEQEALNQKLREGEITISINKTPALKDDKINILVSNEKRNAFPQIIELWTTELKNEEYILKNMVYQSGLIPVGQAIESIDKEDVDLDFNKSEFDLMAVFYNVENETGKIMGAAQTPITLTILKEADINEL